LSTVPEAGDDELQGSPRSERANRAEAVATFAALAWASTVAIIFAVSGGNISLVGLLAISPFIAAAFARPSRVLLVGALATFFALVISTPAHSYGQLNHTLRVLTQVAATAIAMWISYLRSQRTVQLYTARTATRDERRRRVAAETAQRMQTMARALTTAADPAQVADAFFAALREELHVDAATFGLLDERGRPRTLRRFGYRPDEPMDVVLSALRPEGPVLGQTVAVFADSLEDLRRQRPDLASSLEGSGFGALAVVPLVVSDHTIGAVVVHWNDDRDIAEPDRSFLFTITGAAAQAVERARLTLTEFVNLERSQQLQRVSSALAAATTPGEVAQAAITSGRQALGAHSGVVRIPIPGQRALTCLASSGHPSLLSRSMVSVESSHAGSAFRDGVSVVTTIGADEPDQSGDTGDTGVTGDGGEAEQLAADLVPGTLLSAARPFTVVSEPLIGSGGPLGVLSLAFSGQPEPGGPDLRFLATLAGLCAQALQRAQLFEHERAALLVAEAARERLSLLSEVTRLLGSSLDPTTVIRRTMSLVQGRLADSCVMYVPGESGLVSLDVREPLTPGEPLASAPSATEVVPFGADEPAAAAFRTGRTQIAPVVGDDAGGAAADDRLGGAGTTLAVPLTANGEVIGVMSFVDGPGRTFESDDVSLATEVASRAGVALSNATRFQREHVVAEVLQRAVLPDSLPEVPGVLFDAEYRPGVAGTYAGGDWYDVFELHDDLVFFSVGDVMGKGAPAAALMGQVRSAIRAYAVSGQSPAEVLSSLDGLFDTLIEDRVVTTVVGTITPSTGQVVLSNAGHPPPLVLHADGTVTFCQLQHALLIAAGLGGPPRPGDEIVLGPGDSLLMYSDGLIERRGEVITQGMDRLALAATELATGGLPLRPAATFASMLSTDDRTDDVVVLCINYTADRPSGDAGTAEPPVSTARDGMSTLHLEPVVESTPIARHWVSAHLRDLPDEVTQCAALLTSELVTNAVLHAGTSLSITLHVLSDRIRIDVADGSPDFPTVKEYGREAATGRGLTLFNTLASDWGVQGADNGKIVWFEVPVDFPVAPQHVSDGSFRFDLTGLADPAAQGPGASEVVRVHLRGIPVAILQKSSEEYDALFRELRLMKERSDASPRAPALPERLAVFVSDIGTRFGRLGPGMDDMWQRAVDSHIEYFDWSLDLPRSAAVDCEFYAAMLDEADEFGNSQRVLTLPASAESVAVRRWFLSELIGQLRGHPPVAWVDSPSHAELHALPSRGGR
jgi:GAF domain-containing protein/anti-sigma regulatory factor (Ser/Thr protein kinase)